MSMSKNYSVIPAMLTANIGSHAQLCAAKGALIWLERDLERQGKYNVFFSPTKGLSFFEKTFSGIGLLPAEYAVGTRVHEYGGQAIYLELLDSDGEKYDKYVVIFSSISDQRLYAINIFCTSNEEQSTVVNCSEETFMNRKSITGHDVYWTDPLPLTPLNDSSVEYRFACPVLHGDSGYLFAVCEKHETGENANVSNFVVAMPIDGSAAIDKEKMSIVEEGSDFYAFLTISKTGKYLSYIAWDHPDMPWDHTWLITNQIEITSNGIMSKSLYRLHQEDCSITQPLYGSGDTLFCISDISGWTNLYCVVSDGGSHQLRPICKNESEFAKPDWVIGKYSYAECGNNQILAVYTKENVDCLLLIDTDTGTRRLLDLPYTQLDWLSANDGVLYFTAASPYDPPLLCALRISDGAIQHTLQKKPMKKDLIATSEHYEFGVYDKSTVHALIYKPLSDSSQETLPPLLINVHGGPTGSISNSFDISKQFWTSRGFMVADLDFRGSTGHGRSYRKQLKWGETDAEDAIALALALCQDGLVDEKKIFIRGKSSGGFTVLSAMAKSDIFAGGVSYYGVYDPLSLTTNTHKFESHYFESLIGKLPGSEALYRERSIISKVSSIKSPVLLFHGLNDPVVPISQTISLATSLYREGMNCQLFTFESEGHGFRGGATVQFCHIAEWRFYQSISRER